MVDTLYVHRSHLVPLTFLDRESMTLRIVCKVRETPIEAASNINVLAVTYAAYASLV